MSDNPTVKDMLAELGFPTVAGDLDEAVRWALVELHIRRSHLTHWAPTMLSPLSYCGVREGAPESANSNTPAGQCPKCWSALVHQLLREAHEAWQNGYKAGFEDGQKK